MADSLQVQLDALRAAYRSGIRVVSYENKSVTYADPADMRAAIASLELELYGPSAAPRNIVVRSDKGW